MRMYAGDLFLALADQGRLVLDADEAAQAIAGLERTLAALDDRVRQVEEWGAGRAAGHPLPQPVVDALFAEQLAPGAAAAARRELPKYLAALRRAARPRG